MTLRRKLRYHPQCLKQLISELTQNFLHLTPCVPLNYSGNLTGAGVQRRTEPRPYPHITLGTLFYTCVWAWFPLGHRGCVLPGKKAVLLLSAAMTCWLLSQHVLHEGQKWDLWPQVFTECAENRQGKYRFMIWFCLFKSMMLRKIYVWTVTTRITQA